VRFGVVESFLPPDVWTVSGRTGDENATGGGDGAGGNAGGEKIDAEPIVPVTSSGFATFDGAAVTAGCWAIRAKPRVKLINTNEPTAAPAAAKIVILRMEAFSPFQKLSPGTTCHAHPKKLVNIRLWGQGASGHRVEIIAKKLAAAWIWIGSRRRISRGRLQIRRSDLLR
jgi:hypothetical protein